MTLMDRLLNIATESIGAKNYLDIPYLLQLDFFGGDDMKLFNFIF